MDKLKGLSSLPAALREASEASPQGPWYRCNIVLEGQRVRFEYFWESTPFTSIKDIALDQYFARSTDPLTGLDRLPLYGHAYKGLQRIGHEQAASLFADAVGLRQHRGHSFDRTGPQTLVAVLVR